MGQLAIDKQCLLVVDFSTLLVIFMTFGRGWSGIVPTFVFKVLRDLLVVVKCEMMLASRASCDNLPLIYVYSQFRIQRSG